MQKNLKRLNIRREYNGKHDSDAPRIFKRKMFVGGIVEVLITS